jgi:hypothetical protein
MLMLPNTATAIVCSVGVGDKRQNNGNFVAHYSRNGGSVKERKKKVSKKQKTHSRGARVLGIRNIWR